MANSPFAVGGYTPMDEQHIAEIENLPTATDADITAGTPEKLVDASQLKKTLDEVSHEILVATDATAQTVSENNPKDLVVVLEDVPQEPDYLTFSFYDQDPDVPLTNGYITPSFIYAYDEDKPFEYSLDKTTWNLAISGTSIPNTTGKMYFRGKGRTVLTDGSRWTIDTTGKVKISGDIRTLIIVTGKQIGRAHV